MTTEPPTATCTYCNGKGYNTRCYDEIGSDDFGGEGYTKRGLIEKVPCKKCQKEAPKAPREEATENMKAKMNFIQKEWNDPFADDEIIGDHQTIVELYRYARELEAKLEASEKENTKMRDAFTRLDELTQGFDSPNQCLILWGQIAEVVRTVRKSLPTS